MSSDLKKIQEDYNRKIEAIEKEIDIRQSKIEVKPLGGNLGNKVARHSFSTIAKHLFINPDLIMEIMGHEKEGVNNIYRDDFPEKIRDEAHYKVIH